MAPHSARLAVNPPVGHGDHFAGEEELPPRAQIVAFEAGFHGHAQHAVGTPQHVARNVDSSEG